MPDLLAAMRALDQECRSQLVRAYQSDETVAGILALWRDKPDHESVSLPSCLCVIVAQLAAEKRDLKKRLDRAQE